MKYAEAVLAVRQALDSGMGLDEVLAQTMDLTVQVTSAERAAIFLVDAAELSDPEPLLSVRSARNLDTDVTTDPKFQTSRSLIYQVVRSRRSVISHDALKDPYLGGVESVRKLKLRAIIGVPLLVGEAVIGVLYADNRIVGVFSKDQVGALEALAALAATAIARAR